MAEGGTGGGLRGVAERSLAGTVDVEVREWIKSHAEVADKAGLRRIRRNGNLRKRSILAGIEQCEIAQPRMQSRQALLDFHDIYSWLSWHARSSCAFMLSSTCFARSPRVLIASKRRVKA